MTRSELIEKIASEFPDLSLSDCEDAIKLIIDRMTLSLEEGRRIEVRGFGTFCLHVRGARVGRNPRTGASVTVPRRCRPHFKPALALRTRVSQHAQQNKKR